MHLLSPFSLNLPLYEHKKRPSYIGFLTESRTRLKLVLGGVRIVALFISSHEQTKKAESAVFLYCRFSIFLKGSIFPDYLKQAFSFKSV